MNLNNKEKILKINNERKIIFDSIQERLKNSNTNYMNDLVKIAEVLKVEDKNQKEYKAILDAKTLIFELTKEIANSKSVEEIITIRRKINYYINKVKNILKSRGILEEEINTLSSSASYLRKDISNYIRFLKREVKISEIVNLSNKQLLTNEEQETLKKLFKNEIQYIKRSQNPKTVSSKQKSKKESANNLNETTTDDEKEIHKLSPYQKAMFGEILKKEKDYEKRYPLKQLKKYDSNFFINVVRLFKNIPIMFYNKKMIEELKIVYMNLYRGKDLEESIENAKKDNSIINSLKSIFKNSLILKREEQCLNLHKNMLNASCINPVIKDSLILSFEENKMRIR